MKQSAVAGRGGARIVVLTRCRGRNKIVKVLGHHVPALKILLGH